MRKFDIFTKVQDDSFDIRTKTGGIITLFTFFLMVIFAIGESTKFAITQTKQEAISRPSLYYKHTEMDIFLNATIAYPCQLLHLNILDASGNHNLNFHKEITRQRLDTHYDPIEEPIADTDARSVFMECLDCAGSNYTTCCRTCHDIAAAHKLQGKMVPNLNGIEQCTRDHKSIAEAESCRIVAKLKTPFTKGELVITAGGEIQLPVHYKYDLTYFGNNVNLSHVIHTLRFGEPYKGQKNPLDRRFYAQKTRGFWFLRYSCDIVPTLTEGRTNNPANQYSATFSEREIKKQVTKRHPMLAFNFDTAPIAVRIRAERMSLPHFMTSICAILGGAFTLGSLLDSFVFNFHSKDD